MNKESFSFVIYMIHACANKWNMMPSEVYRKMQSVGCIDGYLVPHFDNAGPTSVLFTGSILEKERKDIFPG